MHPAWTPCRMPRYPTTKVNVFPWFDPPCVSSIHQTLLYCKWASNSPLDTAPYRTRTISAANDFEFQGGFVAKPAQNMRYPASLYTNIGCQVLEIHHSFCPGAYTPCPAIMHPSLLEPHILFSQRVGMEYTHGINWRAPNWCQL